ncbi:hypothetical protein N7491_002082 [Penicillium cf. griseofulvum]|uniref:Uncharacterized protein n=1 Tax=Penicillium cf. griseofulvum TaxID=2972120 RepID=A0A9W9T2R6_9EURO|nr:hypothetical protein N7472_003735 [Penicillium cf. griseofulvum]KAJ5446000.1 hypothetical protein N7491_002082 [Penicillium cf. griseofulvum]KAJ5447742.1 hypothetical protein N7445_002563 [Penicillium cf. griseofulvum]
MASLVTGTSKLRQLDVNKREFSMHTKHFLDQEPPMYLQPRDSSKTKQHYELLQASNTDSISDEELNGKLFLFTAASNSSKHYILRHIAAEDVQGHG